MSETVGEVIRRLGNDPVPAEVPINTGGFTALDSHDRVNAYQAGYRKLARRLDALIGDYPIVPCGDQSIVLAVDRDVLARAAAETQCGKMTDEEWEMQREFGWLKEIEAIIAHLRFREVERVVMNNEDRPNVGVLAYTDPPIYVEPGESLVILKPESAQTSKESGE